jgi:hypothetical protein
VGTRLASQLWTFAQVSLSLPTALPSPNPKP